MLSRLWNRCAKLLENLHLAVEPMCVICVDAANDLLEKTLPHKNHTGKNTNKSTYCNSPLTPYDLCVSTISTKPIKTTTLNNIFMKGLIV